MKHTQLFNQGASPLREDRRKHPRITVAVQAELRMDGVDAPTRVETVDLSEGGFYVEMAFTLEVGSRVNVVLWIGEKRIRARGVVVTRHPHFGNGVQFDSMSEEDSAQLSAFLDSKMRGTPEQKPVVQ